MFVETLNIPCVAVVSPYGRFDESVALPLPLREWSPYIKTTASLLARHGETLPVIFEIGYFVGTQQTIEMAERVNTPKGELPRFDPFPIDSQQMAVTGLLREHVPVLIEPR